MKFNSFVHFKYSKLSEEDPMILFLTEVFIKKNVENKSYIYKKKLLPRTYTEYLPRVSLSSAGNYGLKSHILMNISGFTLLYPINNHTRGNLIRVVGYYLCEQKT